MRRVPAPTPGPFLVTAAVLAVLAPAPAPAQDPPRAPFLTTPEGTVHRMLELVEVTARDTLYDLGSGDGRIPIMAAARYGATAVGVELRADLVERARAAAGEAGVGGRVRFVHGDLFDVDLQPATVVTLYLLPSANLRLRPKLLAELRPGARVVSNGFAMGDWEPDREVRDLASGELLYAWVVPARAAGRWRLTTPAGAEVELRLEQRFQELKIHAEDDGVRVSDAGLEGRDVTFLVSLPGRDDPIRYRGTVDGSRMRGRTATGARWSAVRISAPEGSPETPSGGVP